MKTTKCLICLQKRKIIRFKKLVHIVKCTNCKEKDVLVHQECLDNWIKTCLLQLKDITCPHCRDKLELTGEEKTQVFERVYLVSLRFIRTR